MLLPHNWWGRGSLSSFINEETEADGGQISNPAYTASKRQAHVVARWHVPGPGCPGRMISDKVLPSLRYGEDTLCRRGN